MGKTAKATKSVQEKPKKAPRKPYARFHRKFHGNLVRARYNIPSAKSREVDNIVNEILFRELRTLIKVAMLQASAHKRAQITYEDMQYAAAHSGTVFVKSI